MQEAQSPPPFSFSLGPLQRLSRSAGVQSLHSAPGAEVHRCRACTQNQAQRCRGAKCVMFSLISQGAKKGVMFSLKSQESTQCLMFSVKSQGSTKGVMVSWKSQESTKCVTFFLEITRIHKCHMFSLKSQESTKCLTFSVKSLEITRIHKMSHVFLEIARIHKMRHCSLKSLEITRIHKMSHVFLVFHCFDSKLEKKGGFEQHRMAHLKGAGKGPNKVRGDAGRCGEMRGDAGKTGNNR